MAAITCNKLLRASSKDYTTIALLVAAAVIFLMFLIAQTCAVILNRQISDRIEAFFKTVKKHDESLFNEIDDNITSELKYAMYFVRSRKIAMHVGGLLFLCGCAFIALYILCKKFLSQEYSRHLHITRSCLAILIISFSIDIILLSFAAIFTYVKDETILYSVMDKINDEIATFTKNQPLMMYCADAIMADYAEISYAKVMDLIEDNLVYVLQCIKNFKKVAEPHKKGPSEVIKLEDPADSVDSFHGKDF